MRQKIQRTLVLGALVGAGVALLFAPKTGEETQEELKEKGIAYSSGKFPFGASGRTPPAGRPFPSRSRCRLQGREPWPWKRARTMSARGSSSPF